MLTAFIIYHLFSKCQGIFQFFVLILFFNLYSQILNNANKTKTTKPKADHLSFSGFKFRNYPNAESSTIITTKPTATPIVPILECLPCCDSGISSSVTT